MLITRRWREPPAPTLKKGLFERVVSYQQTVLVLSGIAYAFGYASRALHAWDKNLGALPAVRFEYLVAGTLLLIPPIALCLFLWGVWESAKRLASWAEKDPKRHYGVKNVLTGGMLLGLCTILFPDSVRSIGIFFAAGFFLYLLIYLFASKEPPSTSDATTKTAPRGRLEKVWHWVGCIALYVWTVGVGLWIGLLVVGLFSIAVLYGALVLEAVPQEFGGVKPKCGVLDLSPEQLSTELRSIISTPGEQTEPSSKVVRSRPVDVFSASAPWLVRLPSSAPGVPPRSIRLDAKAVMSVEWLPLTTPYCSQR